LVKTDRAMAARGLVRAPDETLNRFAERVDAAGDAHVATWYRHYAEARYGMHEDAPARVARL
jgi:hypothetical protein